MLYIYIYIYIVIYLIVLFFSCRIHAVVTELQQLMCSLDIVCNVAQFLSSTSDDVVREVLALLALLLHNGNRMMQVKTRRVFCGVVTFGKCANFINRLNIHCEV